MPDYLKRQLDTGQKLLGDPEETVGGFDRATAERKAAVAQRIRLIDSATQRLTQLNPTGADRTNLPMLAAASGLLSPGPGGFASSLGRAGERMIPAIQDQRNAEVIHAKGLTDLDMARAQAMESSAGLDYDDLVKRVQLGTTLSNSAVNADVKRQVGLMRAGALGKPVLKVVQGVGLTETSVDPATGKTTSRVVVPSKSPYDDPRVKLSMLRYVQNITKDYDFKTVEDRAQYESELADSLLANPNAAITPNVVHSDLSRAGIKPRAQQTAPGARPDSGASPAPATAGGAPLPVPPAEANPIVPTKVTPYTASVRKTAGREDADIAAKEAQKAREAAEAASSTLSTIAGVRAINAPTGRLAPAKQWFGQWAEALGLPMPKAIGTANNLAAFNAIATNVVLDKQIMQKGVQTEGDAQRMRDTFAQVKNPMEANDLIMRYAAAQASRTMDMSAYMENWKEAKGNKEHYIGAKSEWLKFIREVPIVKNVNGKPVFFNEFLEKARSLNPDEPDVDQLAIDDWKSIKG